MCDNQATTKEWLTLTDVALLHALGKPAKGARRSANRPDGPVHRYVSWPDTPRHVRGGTGGKR